MPIHILKEWWHYHKNWDDLCTCCGKCCYQRHVAEDGEVIICYSRPCEHLDPETHLCRIYSDRLKKCNHCRKVNLWVALFNPTLPNDCPYRTIFRLWEQNTTENKSP